MSIGCTIQTLYEILGDEESKYIFQHRMEYLITEKYEEIFKIVDYCNMKRNMKEKNRMNSPARYFLTAAKDTKEHNAYLLGYGRYVELFYEYATSVGIKVKAQIPYQNTNEICKTLSVCTLEDAIDDDGAEIIIALEDEKETIAALVELRRRKVESNRIVFLSNSEEGYFNVGISGFDPPKDGVYIDGGAYDGNTILRYIKWTGGNYEKIYGFEPDPINYQNLQKNIRMNHIDHVYAVNKGLWNKQRAISFATSGTTGSKISGTGTDTILVDSLENILNQEEKVSFIKLDIEGAEMEALEGMCHIIQRDKPMLAICVYHKKEDIVDILSYIHALVPEYKLYLRHHSQLEYETVLYAYYSETQEQI